MCDTKLSANVVGVTLHYAKCNASIHLHWIQFAQTAINKFPNVNLHTWPLCATFHSSIAGVLIVYLSVCLCSVWATLLKHAPFTLNWASRTKSAIVESFSGWFLIKRPYWDYDMSLSKSSISILIQIQIVLAISQDQTHSRKCSWCIKEVTPNSLFCSHIVCFKSATNRNHENAKWENKKWESSIENVVYFKRRTAFILLLLLWLSTSLPGTWITKEKGLKWILFYLADLSLVNLILIFRQLLCFDWLFNRCNILLFEQMR